MGSTPSSMSNGKKSAKKIKNSKGSATFYCGVDEENKATAVPSEGNFHQEEEDEEEEMERKVDPGKNRKPQRPPPPCPSSHHLTSSSCENIENNRDVYNGTKLSFKQTKKKMKTAFEINELQNKYDDVRQERDTIRALLDEALQEQVSLSNKVKQLQQEADELRLRLSKVASDRLTDNNPNISDLSDGNRATKLGERYSELYSNQWSDAYEELTTSEEKLNEKDAIKVLLSILEAIYSQCKQEATDEMDQLKTLVMKFTGNSKMTKQLSSSLKFYKDERKKNYKHTIPNLREVVSAFVSNVNTDDSAVSLYAKEATEICWLMCIQDPPLDIITRCKKGTEFDYQLFDAYTVRGKHFAFPVWPALLLHEKGPVLHKGVAQGMKKRNRAWGESGDGIRPSEKYTGEHTAKFETANEKGGQDLMLSSIRSDDLEQHKHKSCSLVGVKNRNNNLSFAEKQPIVDETVSRDNDCERFNQQENQNDPTSNDHKSKATKTKSLLKTDGLNNHENASESQNMLENEKVVMLERKGLSETEKKANSARKNEHAYSKILRNSAEGDIQVSTEENENDLLALAGDLNGSVKETHFDDSYHRDGLEKDISDSEHEINVTERADLSESIRQSSSRERRRAKNKLKHSISTEE